MLAAFWPSSFALGVFRMLLQLEYLVENSAGFECTPLLKIFVKLSPNIPDFHVQHIEMMTFFAQRFIPEC
jgi:hypothetical protein